MLTYLRGQDEDTRWDTGLTKCVFFSSISLSVTRRQAIRLFRHLYLWDYFLKVKAFFEQFLEENESVLDAKNRDEHVNVMSGYINIVDKIETAAAHTVGKDQRFQVSDGTLSHR